VLGVGPIQLPEYLNRPQMVVEASEHRLVLAEFDRWAEPVQPAFSRALAENLSALLGTDRVYLLPAPSAPPIDHRLTMTVTRFDGAPGRSAVLIARWQILGPDGKEMVPMRRSQHVVATKARSYEGLAEAMSEALAALSGEIAEAMSQGRGPSRSAAP
jgi:hypothetical protein